MLLDQDPLRQRMRIIAIQHRDYPLQDNHAVIQLFVDKVDCASRNLAAVIEGLLLRVQSRKSRQE